MTEATPKNWTAKCVRTPLGLEVQITLTDGARIYLNKEIAREFGNQIRGACDEVEVRQSELDAASERGFGDAYDPFDRFYENEIVK